MAFIFGTITLYSNRIFLPIPLLLQCLKKEPKTVASSLSATRNKFNILGRETTRIELKRRFCFELQKYYK